MRRLAALCCLGALLWGQLAQAKSLIVYPYNSLVAAGQVRRIYPQELRTLSNVQQVIAATGGTFRAVRSDQSRTEFARSGQQVWNPGTAGAYVESFDAFIWTGHRIVTSAFAGQVRPDSLSQGVLQAAGTGNAVPSLEVVDNSEQSTSTNWGGSDSSQATLDNATGARGAFLPGDHYAFLTAPNQAGIYIVNSAAGASVRDVLFAKTPAIEGTHSALGGYQGCVQCDSLDSYPDLPTAIAGNTDTTLIFDVQMNKTIAKASTITYVSQGLADVADSLSGKPGTGGDLAVLLAALAHVDSLSGHKVLGDKVIRIAPVVYGGLTRTGNRTAWDWTKSQGIHVADTTAFYGFIDSCRVYGIPITFAVDVDSAAAYARDVIKMRTCTSARFTPQIWGGVNDTSLTAYSMFPKDVFGRYNNRIAVGDSVNHYLCNGGGDSSVAWQARRALNMCDSIFGGRTSRVAVAPSDDWSPKGVLGNKNAVAGIDSVLYALQLAGYSGVIADAEDPDCNATKTSGGPSQTNPRGYYNVQQTYSSGSVAGLRRFKILCHTGFMILGSGAQVYAGKDSTTAGLGFPVYPAYQEIARVWEGALLTQDRNYEMFPNDAVAAAATALMRTKADDIQTRKVDRTTLGAVRHGNIMRLSCQDLSGRSGANGPPAGNGWIALKSIWCAMRTINKLAGRVVVTFSYPEDIDP